MRRRDFIKVMAGSAAAWPLAVRAQQSTMPVIGWLSRGFAELEGNRLSAFRQGLKEFGIVEGKNAIVEYRWANEKPETLGALAADFVRRRVDVILAAEDSAALAAKAATATIPIVFTSGNDPVRLGLVASLNRPGGNLTGVNNLNFELMGKRVQLLRELTRSVTAVTAFVNPTNPSVETVTRDLQSAAGNFNLELRILHVRDDKQIDAAFPTIGQPGALILGADAFYMSRSEKLGALTVRYRLPAIFQTRGFVVAGGLASYAASLSEQYRTAGNYVARILKGEKPADLAVQRVTKPELVINAKTAKALGLTIPPALLSTADEVIE
jgi:putative ABC transport system substrate-binding protein